MTPTDVILYAIAALISIVPALLLLAAGIAICGIVLVGLISAAIFIWEIPPMRYTSISLLVLGSGGWLIKHELQKPPKPPPTCEDQCHSAYSGGWGVQNRINCLRLCKEQHELESK